jgi:hypothetical protein
MGSSPITCCAAMRWALIAHGLRRLQHKKAAGAFRPLERGVMGRLDDDEGWYVSYQPWQDVNNLMWSAHPASTASL